jgi:enamine deaminase RidA (YjgF/YER057c/UK114 family)
MERRLVSDGTEWEREVGYSRAVRAGDTVHVAGTTAIDDDGESVAPGDP